MAAMDQGKLTNMCTALNEAASEYASNIVSDAASVVEEFNKNWVSNAARKLSGEIGEKIALLEADIASEFNGKNAAIRAAVSNFNRMEEENISYKGFNFGKPEISMDLGATLPSGKVGVAEGADLNSIANPMKTLIKNVNVTLENISSTVKTCDAFDSAEINALTSGVEKIKSAFETGMQGLISSLESRMGEEIQARDSLNNANQEILQ